MSTLAPPQSKWALWAVVNGDGRMERLRDPKDEDLPQDAEVSGDGNWAAQYEDGRPVRHWVRRAF